MKHFGIIALLLCFAYSNAQTEHSVFATGDWYKLAVKETGIYRITYDDLVSYGISPLQIDPDNLVIFGKPAGMLPEIYQSGDALVLQELPIEIHGVEDGIFNTSDYILFYGQSPVTWSYEEELERYRHQLNYYTDETYYFLSVSEFKGKRIEVEQIAEDQATDTISYFDQLTYHELELENPLKSGKQWLGEAFHETNPLIFTYDNNDADFLPVLYDFKVGFALRSTGQSDIDIFINNELITTKKLPVITENMYFLQSYRETVFDTGNISIDDQLTLGFEFNKAIDSSEAWLGYFTVQLKMANYFGDGQKFLTTQDNVGIDEVSYFSFDYDDIENWSLWNVADPLNVTSLDLQSNDDGFWVRMNTPEAPQLCIFSNKIYFETRLVGQIANQDLLAMETPEYLIITHPDFVSQAMSVKQFHENDLETEVVTTDQIFNEFGAGVSDISAIRNFIWYLNDKSEEGLLNYVLLFGEASFDYKNILALDSRQVPTYESLESANMVHSFASDKFYGLKDITELNQDQISIGRIPVENTDAADEYLEKMMTYTSQASFGNWKNEMMFIADDGDQNLHLNQADYLVEIAEEGIPEMNITKCYFDFYEFVETAEGYRYPEVNAEIEQKTNEGVFYTNYSGHGNNQELAQERVLAISDLDRWNNNNYLPLWVISSGDVVRYDDPGAYSLGESMLMLENAGAVAVIGSTRATFASSNLNVNSKVMELFSNPNTQQNLRLGDLINFSMVSDQELKWTLLGDPALRISFTEYNVATTKINDIDINLFTDTVSPGSTLKIDGVISEKGNFNIQSGFNGKLSLKVFAPAYEKTTNGNQSVPTEVIVQDSVLAVANSIVTNGEFTIDVSFPSRYMPGFGDLKLSYYATADESDASGNYNQLVYGGEPSSLKTPEDILNNVKVYPSPFRNEITIDLPLHSSEQYNIDVFSLMGEKVYSIRAGNGGSSKRLDLGFLSRGIYMVRVSNSVSSKNIKIVKE